LKILETVTYPGDMGLPTFLIIGAAKAGTTSLYEYLRAHPDVHMPAVKEPRFWAVQGSDKGLLPTDVRDRATYEALFETPLAIRGEASPAYSTYPGWGDVAGRIHEAMPDVKLIYLVRDPAVRTISNYYHAFLNGHDERPPEVAFANLEEPYNTYTRGSRYATQVERYLRLFPQEQMMVIDNARLAADTPAVLRDVFGFIGADPDFAVDTTARHNVTEGKRKKHPRLLRIRYGTASRVFDAIPTGLRQPLGHLGSKVLYGGEVEKPEIPADIVERLERHLAPEAARLRELTGQPFSSWTI
jgi:sulfotransferase family protein